MDVASPIHLNEGPERVRRHYSYRLLVPLVVLLVGAAGVCFWVFLSRSQLRLRDESEISSLLSQGAIRDPCARGLWRVPEGIDICVVLWLTSSCLPCQVDSFLTRAAEVVARGRREFGKTVGVGIVVPELLDCVDADNIRFYYKMALLVLSASDEARQRKLALSPIGNRIVLISSRGAPMWAGDLGSDAWVSALTGALRQSSAVEY